MARTYADKSAARLAKKRRHRSRSSLDVQTRSAIAKKAADTKAAIATALAAERVRQEAFVLELAKKHHIAVSAMRQRLLGASSFKTQRRVNKFNAWIHCRSLDINESEFTLQAVCICLADSCFLDVPEGSRAKLKELQDQALAHEDYHTIPPLQITAMVRELEAYRLLKQTGASLQRNGRTQDIRFTTSRIDQEVRGSHYNTRYVLTWHGSSRIYESAHRRRRCASQ